MLPRILVLAFALVALNGCNTIWSAGHPFTESTQGGDPHAYTVSVEERNAQKKAWDDELARQSQQRLRGYFW